MKTCKDCQICLPEAAFAKNAKTSDGLYTYCRTCAKRRKDAYRAANPDKDRLHAVDYYQRNKEKISAICKAYHKKNRERRLQQIRDYYIANQEQMQARARKVTKELADHYVRRVLMPKQNIISRGELPPALVQAKRFQLMIKRATERNEDEKC